MTRSWIPFLPSLALLAACVGAESEPAREAALDHAEDAVEYENMLMPNAVNPNAVNPNALSASALTTGALDPRFVQAIQDPGEAGELARQLLKYAVSCALDATQSVSCSWTDATAVVHNETYWGLIGLATTWADGPLSTSGQHWVSACLASRVNWYGVSVTISSRASHSALNKSDAPELATYPLEEGAFWGNLFAASPRLYACHRGPNDDNSRLHWRDCAAGHLTGGGGVLECGILHIVGDCDARCDPLHPTGIYRPNCMDDAGAWASKVISVFLPGP